ncbi:MAG TPA: TlpA disulfide reductase family protein [Chitinophagales bacterium]|nr:TlpA disulfide reductase family protein [Chitinophagales bacterium]
MNKKIFSFLIFLFPLAAAAQNSVNIHCTFARGGVKFTIQSGQLAATAGDTVIVIPAQYFIDDYEKSYQTTISNNECDLNFAVAKPTTAQFTYHHQSIPLFVEPGDEMQVDVGNDSLYKVISFSGKGAVHNEFLKNFFQTFNKDFDRAAINNSILSMDVDAFEIKLFDERKKQRDFYNTYKDKDVFSPMFRNYVENMIRYNYYACLLSYPIIQANQSAQILTVKAFPSVMLDGIDSKLMNDDALNCEVYRDFLYYYNVYFTSAANGFNKFKDMSLSMEGKVTTANKNFSEQSAIWFIAWYLNHDLQKVSQYTAKHIYDVLSLKENNGTYSKLLKSKVDARLAMKDVVGSSPLGSNANASPAGSSRTSNESKSGGYPMLKDIDGNNFTFDDLKGKVVYVDYWASWCGPCRNEMPYSKQLHEMFTPQQLKQIVFLYISIDQSEDAWKNAVKQIGMEGKLAISPGNWNSPIATFFQINSIPRYMLIDKKGNIVDLNAKRPSTGQEVYGDILRLLE